MVIDTPTEAQCGKEFWLVVSRHHAMFLLPATMSQRTSTTSTVLFALESIARGGGRSTKADGGKPVFAPRLSGSCVCGRPLSGWRATRPCRLPELRLGNLDRDYSQRFKMGGPTCTIPGRQYRFGARLRYSLRRTFLPRPLSDVFNVWVVFINSPHDGQRTRPLAAP